MFGAMLNLVVLAMMIPAFRFTLIGFSEESSKFDKMFSAYALFSMAAVLGGLTMAFYI
jgi:hypothetical protein